MKSYASELKGSRIKYMMGGREIESSREEGERKRKFCLLYDCCALREPRRAASLFPNIMLMTIVTRALVLEGMYKGAAAAVLLHSPRGIKKLMRILRVCGDRA